MIVLDTNVAIAGLKNGKPFLPPDQDFALSIISEIELLSFPAAAEDELLSIRRFLESVHVIGLTDPIKQMTIKVRRQHRLKLPDAIIAATALVMDATLFTLDQDFSRVASLKVSVPVLPV